MTGAALFLSFPLRRQAVSRLRLALAASVAGHLLIALGTASEPLEGKQGFVGTASLTVRLLPQQATEAAELALTEPESPIAAPRTRSPVPVTDREQRAATAALGKRAAREERPLSLPQVADRNYYGVRDLDVYPRPVVPLALDRIPAGNTVPMRVAVALRIDEEGAVNDVAFPDPAAPERLREDLRAALAATRFLPARKDGRAVRSQVILSVDFAQERREP